LNKNEIFIKGNHNICNSGIAVCAAKYFGVSDDVIINTLKTFKGVEHRIEPVREINGITFYNDSKATNFDSLYVALESFPSNIILIMGGKKGDNNFKTVDEFIRDRVKIIIAIGQSKDAISDYFGSFKNVIKSKTLEDAVNTAYENAVGGDAVIFSPAYKSFDMFDNYEHRGKEFKMCVNNLKAEQ